MMTIYRRAIAYITLASACVGILGACASADRPSLLQTPTTARPKPIQETSANMGSLSQQIPVGPMYQWLAIAHYLKTDAPEM